MVDSVESAELDKVFVEFLRWAKAYTGDFIVFAVCTIANITLTLTLVSSTKDSTPTLERVQEERAVERGYLDKGAVTELRTLVVKYLDSGWSSSDVQRYLSLINTIDDALDLMRMSGNSVEFCVLPHFFKSNCLLSRL